MKVRCTPDCGFTLIEAVIVMAILCLGVVTFALRTHSMMPDLHLKAAARDLKSDLHLARLCAIRHNTFVVADFNSREGDYTIYIDNGAGDYTKANNHKQDEGEETIKFVRLRSGVRIIRARFGRVEGKFSFNGRGAVNGLSGGIYMRNYLNRYRCVTVSRIGKLTIKASSDGSVWHAVN